MSRMMATLPLSLTFLVIQTGGKLSEYSSYGDLASSQTETLLSYLA